MSLAIVTFQLGPMGNNSYLLADPATCKAAVIDPSFESEAILAEAGKRGWEIKQIWLTHAHFDHLAGAALIANASEPPVPVGLHPADDSLWRSKGGSGLFGVQVDPGPEPVIKFYHGQKLKLGDNELEVRHTPGHTPGHAIFYSAAEKTAFCGDLIFAGSIGRTDLPGGSYEEILRSIRMQVLTLPPETRLLPGHGPETSVAAELAGNPFLKDR